MNYRNRRINHVFANRYYASVIRKESHIMNVIRYIYQNPVRAGLVETITDYPYSSLGFYLGYNNYGLKLDPDAITKEYWKETLRGREQWIEKIQRTYTSTEAAIIKQSLRRTTFRFSRDQLTNIEKNGTTIVV
jgi:putative transposase